MATRFCTVCGAALRDGVCPRGHPQRAVRRASPKRGRGWLGALVVLLLLAAGAYFALSWYPERAAGELMRPSSAEFTDALRSYRATVEVFPTAALDPEAIPESAQTVLAATGDARESLSAASARLEDREPARFPVVSSRPPLGEAIRIRERMLAFYTAALETVGDLEQSAGYLTELAGVLPQLDNLEGALAEDEQSVEQTVAAATPIADQMVADLRALGPPDELGSLHATLLAVAERIREDLMEVGTGQSAGPVAVALLEDVRSDVDSFRETVGTAPEAARDGGLEARLDQVEAEAARIVEDLRLLRSSYRLGGLTVPRAHGLAR